MMECIEIFCQNFKYAIQSAVPIYEFFSKVKNLPIFSSSSIEWLSINIWQYMYQ